MLIENNYIDLNNAASAVFRNPDAMYSLKEAAVAIKMESAAYTVPNSALRTIAWFAMGFKYPTTLEAFWEGFVQ